KRQRQRPSTLGVTNNGHLTVNEKRRDFIEHAAIQRQDFYPGSPGEGPATRSLIQLTLHRGQTHFQHVRPPLNPSVEFLLVNLPEIERHILEHLTRTRLR